MAIDFPKLEFTLNIKPISYNAYYRNTRNGMRVKTGKGLAYDEELIQLLEENADALKSFGRYMNPSSIIVKLTLRFANTGFYLKNGTRISKTAGDVDNTVKVLQDKIFTTMQYDDYICRHIDVADFPSDHDAIFVCMEIQPIPSFQGTLELFQCSESEFYLPPVSPLGVDLLS